MASRKKRECTLNITSHAQCPKKSKARGGAQWYQGFVPSSGKDQQGIWILWLLGCEGVPQTHCLWNCLCLSVFLSINHLSIHHLSIIYLPIYLSSIILLLSIYLSSINLFICHPHIFISPIYLSSTYHLLCLCVHVGMHASSGMRMTRCACRGQKTAFKGLFLSFHHVVLGNITWAIGLSSLTHWAIFPAQLPFKRKHSDAATGMCLVCSDYLFKIDKIWYDVIVYEHTEQREMQNGSWLLWIPSPHDEQTIKK